MLPLVYIASPYTKGDCGRNVRCSLIVMSHLIRGRACIPVSPLALTHVTHMLSPLSYEDWMEYDMGLVAKCDAILRVNAVDGDYFQSESPGADREVAFAIDAGIPVFMDIETLEDWLCGL